MYPQITGYFIFFKHCETYCNKGDELNNNFFKVFYSKLSHQQPPTVWLWVYDSECGLSPVHAQSTIGWNKRRFMFASYYYCRAVIFDSMLNLLMFMDLDTSSRIKAICY